MKTDMPRYNAAQHGRGRGKSRGHDRRRLRTNPGNSRREEDSLLVASDMPGSRLPLEPLRSLAVSDNEESSTSDSDSGGLNFETAASSTIGAHALDSDKALNTDRLSLGQDLAADFSCLSQVLARVPLWARLDTSTELLELVSRGSHETTSDQLLRFDAPHGIAGGEKPDHAAAANGCKTCPLDASSSDSEKPELQGNDDFDAWLDDV